MTATRLQQILGENIEKLNALDANAELLKAPTAKADALTKLSRQMINNSQVILRAGKSTGDKVTEVKAASFVLGDL